jgi:hypothetical protein
MFHGQKAVNSPSASARRRWNSFIITMEMLTVKIKNQFIS